MGGEHGPGASRARGARGEWGPGRPCPVLPIGTVAAAPAGPGARRSLGREEAHESGSGFALQWQLHINLKNS